MSDYPYETQLLLRLILAVICGGVLGYERERHGRSAGFRTNILVCLGAALMMVVSKYFYYKPGELISNIPIAVDPARIGAQIVTGIGFLGAGVIIKERGGVRGLTTAATLWFNAGVGMACGAGMIILPIFCTIIGLISLTLLKRLGDKISRDTYKSIHVECNESGDKALPALLSYFSSKKISIMNVNFSHNVKEASANYEFVIKGSWRDSEILLHINQLKNLEFINQIKLS
ncbi:MAG TPA: MgtC/SapB family protein [Nitrospirota bacterium]|nr:MgtC/SapB family protein [Nitrospirota bacterium]